MKTFTAQISIKADKSTVFNAISTPKEFSLAVPKILEVEILSEQKEGLGTKFRETREMNGKKSSVVLEVIGYDQDNSIQLVSTAGGSTWDSIFTVDNDGNETILKLTMTSKPHNIFAKLMNGLIAKMLTKALNEDLNSIKKYCEN